MSASMKAGSAGRPAPLPWGDILLSAIASVSWALIGMAGTAALGLHLLEADTSGSLGPMTAAVVALGAGGSVTPSGDVSAFGLTGAEASTAIEITPLGVGLVGAVLLAWCFLRSLRRAGVVIAPAELLARAGAVVALFVATLGGLAWAGHDVITIDGGALGLDDLPGAGGAGGSLEIPGIGDVGGLLPDRLGGLVDAKAAVGFSVDRAPTLLGGLAWSAGVLLIALLASRRTPLPPGWQTVHRVVRPAVSALVTVLLVAVAAGLAAAGYAALRDDAPGRIAGAALLGAPNGVWLGVPLGLFVPFEGRATGVLTGLLPDPLDDLLKGGTDQPVTLGRLAELDDRVWLLGIAAALMMLLAGVLTAVRTPVRTPEETAVQTPVRTPEETAVQTPVRTPEETVVQTPVRTPEGTPAAASRGVRDPGGLRFAGRCALRLGAVTAAALPLLALLTGLSVDASLSVLGFDAFGAGVELRGELGTALVLGAVWGAGAGAVGASAALVAGAAGTRAAPLALGVRGAGGAGAGGTGGWVGAVGVGGPGAGAGGAGAGGAGAGGAAGRGRSGVGGAGAGPYTPGTEGTGAGPHAPSAETGLGAGPYRSDTGGTGAGPYPPSAEGTGAGTAGRAGRRGPGAEGGGTGPYSGASGPYAPGTEGTGTAPYAPGTEGTGAGPYAPGTPYRPPNPATNPYLRMPEPPRRDDRPPEDSAPPGSAGRHKGSASPGRPAGARPRGDARRPGNPPSAERSPSGEPPSSEPPPAGDGDVHGAPTMRRPVDPPPRSPRNPRGPKRRGDGPPSGPGDVPPPPPPPPPPRDPKGRP